MIFLLLCYFHYSITWGVTALAYLLAALQARALYLAVASRFIKSPLAVTWVILVVYWALPLFDVMRANALEPVYEPVRYSLLSTVSPAGVIAMQWSSVAAPLGTGLLCQAGVPVLLTLLRKRSASPS